MENALTKFSEGALAFLIGCAIFIATPLYLGGVGLSWDAFNHHIYLGWAATSSRLAIDVWAAGSQSYQYPYLFVPAFQLMQAGVPGEVAGTILCAVQALIIPPVWLVARKCIDGSEPVDRVIRIAVVVLAITSSLPLSLVSTTSNDLLSAIPMMWGVAFLIGKNRDLFGVCMCGCLIGISVAFKLSNAPVAAAVPLLFFFLPTTWRERIIRAFVCLTGMVVGYWVAYLPWGYQLYREFGSFYYPVSPLDML